MSKLLVIDSRDRVSGMPENFQIQMHRGYFYDKIELLSASIPLAGYNVNANNNVIYWTSSVDGAKSASITSGYYDTTTLPSAVSAAMNAAGTVTYTVVYSAISGGFTITPSSGTISMQFGTNTLNSARVVLGFSQANTTAASTAVSNIVADLSAPRYIMVSITNTANSTKTTNSQDGATFVIPTNVNTQAMQNFNERTNFYECEETSTLQNFTVTLTTHANQIYSMNGIEWSIIVRLTKNHSTGGSIY